MKLSTLVLIRQLKWKASVHLLHVLFSIKLSVLAIQYTHDILGHTIQSILCTISMQYVCGTECYKLHSDRTSCSLHSSTDFVSIFSSLNDIVHFPESPLTLNSTCLKAAVHYDLLNVEDLVPVPVKQWISLCCSVARGWVQEETLILKDKQVNVSDIWGI